MSQKRNSTYLYTIDTGDLRDRHHHRFLPLLLLPPLPLQRQSLPPPSWTSPLLPLPQLHTPLRLLPLPPPLQPPWLRRRRCHRCNCRPHCRLRSQSCDQLTVRMVLMGRHATLV